MVTQDDSLGPQAGNPQAEQATGDEAPAAEARVGTTRPLVLVGLMGAGKSSVGRRLAAKLDLPFRDADTEIEQRSGFSIPDYFERFGESDFRDGERRVIQSLLEEGPMVLATGGGAFMDPKTRECIRATSISVWLKADLETLVERTSRSTNRPLLKDKDPRKVLQNLMDQRYPVYAEADVTVETGQDSPDATVEMVVSALKDRV